MKKKSIVFIDCLLSVCSYSQEHIKYNGATFGKPLNEFIKNFPQTPSKSYNGFPKEYSSRDKTTREYNSLMRDTL